MVTMSEGLIPGDKAVTLWDSRQRHPSLSTARTTYHCFTVCKFFTVYKISFFGIRVRAALAFNASAVMLIFPGQPGGCL